MTDKEQIIIDGIAVRNCNFFLSSNKYCGLYSTGCRFVPNCHFKQLARKTQEFEQLQEKYEALKLENEEGYEIVDELKQECEELKEQLTYLTEYRKKNQTCTECYEDGYNVGKGENRELARYRKALERIKYEATEEMKDLEADTNAYGCFMEILNIINKAKGRDNE